MDLRNAFDGNSLSLSSPVGDQSPMVSWTESSQNGPASQGHEVIEDGEQGNGGVSSSGRDQWSYADLISTISLCEATKMAVKYGLEVAFPQQTGRVLNPHSNHVTFSKTFLKFLQCDSPYILTSLGY